MSDLVELALTIRPERPGDAESIDGLIARAFAAHPHSDGSEFRIVRELRSAGDLAIALVATDAVGVLLGHVAFSPVALSDGSRDWYGLAPVSVEPTGQRRGIGGALVRAGLEALREKGAAGCVVFGDPTYYGRFGFARCDGLVYRGGPAELFQASSFVGPIPIAEVAYHTAFDPSTDPSLTRAVDPAPRPPSARPDTESN